MTENSTVKGEIQQNYKSFLKLRNVSKNSPLTFHCMDGKINAFRTTIEEAPIFSFNVIGTISLSFNFGGCEGKGGSSKAQISATVPQTPFIVDPNNSTISLVKDQQSSLRCEGYGLPQPTFQWIKVNFAFPKIDRHLYNQNVWQDGIVLTGNDIVSPRGNLSFLNLHGIAGENGTYACRLNNSRHESFKYFTVKFAEESQLSTVIISVVIFLAVVLIAAIGLSIKLYRDKVYIWLNFSFTVSEIPIRPFQQKLNLFPGAEALLRGNPNEINDELGLDDQIEILPYDRRWEFPRNRLKLGKSSQYLVDCLIVIHFWMKVCSWEPDVSVESSKPRPLESKIRRKRSKRWPSKWFALKPTPLL